MTYITQTTGYIFLAIFGLAMFLITKYFSKNTNKENFLVANRKVDWFIGGTSIAASWIWAPALFISVQIAFQMGLAGIFWFTVPNILALAVFAILAPKIRKRLPQGYTLPQYIKQRFNSKRVHKMYLFPYCFYQLMAVTVQLFAGGSLLSLLTGIPLIIAMPILAVISLSYTLLSGLKASVITDFVQLGFIFIIGIIIIPMAINAGGITGVQAITGSAITETAVDGNFLLEKVKEILNPEVAFSFGIVTAIGLLAGAISDQQYWQRSFAIKKNHLKKAFIFGAILFGIVPIALSTLGFIAADQGITVPEGIDISMIGVQTVATLLPQWAVFLFVIMLLAGLSSTLDSGLSAFSSLWVTDIAKPTSETSAIRHARFAMILISVLGLAVALAVNYIPNFGLQHLWWIFNTIAACVMVPTVLSLFKRNLSEKGVFYGILTAFVLGIPLFIYGNIINSAVWIVSSSLGIVGVSTLFCLIRKEKMASSR